MQHQLYLNGKSWDEFLIECDLGLTQYWPNTSPKTSRKRKAAAKPEVNNVLETESEGKGLINVGISNEDVDNIVPRCSKTVLNRPPSDRYHSTPAKTEEGLIENKDINTVHCKNLSKFP